MSDDIMYCSKEDCYMVSEERLEEFEKAVADAKYWEYRFVSANIRGKDLMSELDMVEAERDRFRDLVNETERMRQDKIKELKSLQSECIRLGYGERDTDGNFVLKDGENCTSE